MKTIRIGMIGANPRALWYAALFDDVDPERFAALVPAHYHHLTYYDREELWLNRARGFHLARVYDPDFTAAEQLAAAFRHPVRPCRTLDEVSDDVDLVFIANESGDGSDHRGLSSPGLMKSVPTFVDRPLARTVKDARAMVRLAKKHSSPLLSCSHLRMLPHAAWFKARYREFHRVERGTVQGHGPNPAHIADGIELSLFLFGDPFGGRVDCVQSTGDWPLQILWTRYATAEQRHVLAGLVLSNAPATPRQPFFAKAVSLGKPLMTDDLDAFVQPEGGLGVLNTLHEMVASGRPPLSVATMIEHVAVAEAGRLAHERGEAVMVRDVRGRG
ncbi:MAG TPA: hypothetical protein DIT01_07170 [Lentisphaeria bacterium]|nr:hypothetical protein [Lentisphaeria bacterium]|tara:strand:- start:47 stop:1036 length:990 start_codon:yes stop_codon:yes gene_type:complete